MHRQVVLQLNIDLGKIVVHPHVRQRGHVGGRDGAYVEGDVIVHGTDGREREGGVHEGVRRHPGLMEVLRNRSGDDFDSLDFLHGLFHGRADPLEAVLCRGRKEKKQSSYKQNPLSLVRGRTAWSAALPSGEETSPHPQASCVPMLPATACKQQPFKAREAASRSRVVACTPLEQDFGGVWCRAAMRRKARKQPGCGKKPPKPELGTLCPHNTLSLISKRR